jgi:hypothetical protein
MRLPYFGQRGFRRRLEVEGDEVSAADGVEEGAGHYVWLTYGQVWRYFTSFGSGLAQFVHKVCARARVRVRVHVRQHCVHTRSLISACVCSVHITSTTLSGYAERTASNGRSPVRDDALQHGAFVPLESL